MGSEMCIRDRVAASRRPGTARTFWKERGVSRVVPMGLSIGDSVLASGNSSNVLEGAACF